MGAAVKPPLLVLARHNIEANQLARGTGLPGNGKQRERRMRHVLENVNRRLALRFAYEDDQPRLVCGNSPQMHRDIPRRTEQIAW